MAKSAQVEELLAKIAAMEKAAEEQAARIVELESKPTTIVTVQKKGRMYELLDAIEASKTTKGDSITDLAKTLGWSTGNVSSYKCYLGASGWIFTTQSGKFRITGYSRKRIDPTKHHLGADKHKDPAAYEAAIVAFETRWASWTGETTFAE